MVRLAWDVSASGSVMWCGYGGWVDVVVCVVVCVVAYVVGVVYCCA